jgi:hypothetical protein
MSRVQLCSFSWRGTGERREVHARSACPLPPAGIKLPSSLFFLPRHHFLFHRTKELSDMVMFPLRACSKEWDQHSMAAAKQKSAFWDPMSKSRPPLRIFGSLICCFCIFTNGKLILESFRSKNGVYFKTCGCPSSSAKWSDDA